MSKARDIANILSANTAIATDAEVTSSVSAAVSTHATAANGHIGRGTTGQRPASPSIGDTYFDTTLAALISYKSGGWEKVSQDPAPQIASISPTTAGTTGTTITITGSNFKSGLTVQFIGADATSYNSPVASFVNGATATATTPVLSVANEPYDVKVINNDNQFAILENALDAGGTPTWNTASGTIATINEQTALNVSVSATDPDGTSIVYSSSNLPIATPTPVTFQVTNSGSGAYLIDGVSNGTITLTRGGTYTFNVNASGHPFYIQTTGNGYNSNNVYSTGVTGAGAQVGTVTFVVPNNAPNTLFYQCQYHSGMFGQINVVSATPWVTLNPSTGSLTGTAPNIESNTTYNFDITASDGVNTSSRSFNVVVNYVIPVVTADFLVVAGGGSGGVHHGGGGGAGGLRSTVDNTGGLGTLETTLTLNPGTTYTVTVGGGGAARSGSGGVGNAGSNSVFSTITSTGGGAGAFESSNVGGTGGSGGGGGGNGFGGTGGSRTASPVQGFNGGKGNNVNGDGNGGGGGGAGAAAVQPSTGAGNGGIGASVSITGSAVYYAGGGGGARHVSGTGSTGGTGGTGGGGAGANGSGAVTAGTTNTGGGGGGSMNTDTSGAGGSGVVIVRATQAASSTTGSPTYTTSGSYHIYKFNGDGSIVY